MSPADSLPTRILTNFLHLGPIGFLGHVAVLVIALALLVQIVRLYVRPRRIGETVRWLIFIPVPAVGGMVLSAYETILWSYYDSTVVGINSLPQLPAALIGLAQPMFIGGMLTFCLFVAAFPLVLLAPGRQE